MRRFDSPISDPARRLPPALSIVAAGFHWRSVVPDSITSDASALPSPLPLARQRLDRAARLWFVTALLGQAAFVAFIVGFFLPPLLAGDPAALNAKPHITGWVAGDTMGNLQLLMHVFVGAAVTASGLVQLVPAVRQRWPAVHRWNGRAFMTFALVATLSGFYLTWVRGSQLNLASALATSANGALIVVFVALAWRSAVRGDIATHRGHALRAWVLVNGVWFLRIGIMLAGLGLAPFGVEMAVDGAVFIGVSVASWALPLLVVEAYLAAGRSRSPRPIRAMTIALQGLAALTAAGSAAAVAFMWWPRL